MKKLRMDLNIHFEKEAVIKKKLYELDMKSENGAFDLFSLQLRFTKLKNKENKIGESENTEPLEQDISRVKTEIELVINQKDKLQQKLENLEVKREELMEVREFLYWIDLSIEID
jgi:chromosome segregation ATPase